jgi:cytochrome c-type biogenesis protein CcmH
MHVNARRAAWAALAVVVAAALGLLVFGSDVDRSEAARVQRLTEQLACPVCDGQAVADSNAPESRAIRAKIAELVARGDSDDQVRAFFVRRYGEEILLTPARDGIGLVAWMLPLFVLLAGGFGVGALVWRWSRVPRLAATDADEAIVRAAIERERSSGGDGP